jgi:hypothetical protein
VNCCGVELVGNLHGSQGARTASGRTCRRRGLRGRPFFALDRRHGI